MKKALVTMLLLACTACMVFAYQFSPMEQTFGASGVDAQKTYTIINDSDEDIAIRLAVYERDMDEFGNEIRSEVPSKEFLVTPANVIVRAQSAYVVRVRYRGPSVVANEKSYRLVAEQVPYSTGAGQNDGAMFNFLYVFVTSIYVKPSKVIESVEVQNISARIDEEGNQVMDVTLGNVGNVHQILYYAKLQVNGQGSSVDIEGLEGLGGIDGTNILANRSVTKTIPWPQGLEFVEGGSYKGHFSYINQ